MSSILTNQKVASIGSVTVQLPYYTVNSSKFQKFRKVILTGILIWRFYQYLKMTATLATVPAIAKIDTSHRDLIVWKI